MFKTLTGRLAVFFVAATAVTLGLIAFIEHSIHGARIHQTSMEHYRIVASQTLGIMLLAMEREPPGSIDEFLAFVCGKNSVELIRVLDTSGTIKHSSRPAEIGETSRPIDPGWLARGQVDLAAEERDERTAVTILDPIVNEARCQRCHTEGPINGVFEVRLDATETTKSLQAEQWTLMTAMGLSMLLVFGLLWLLSRRFLIRPVRTLLASMRRVENGDLNEKVQLGSPREFAELGSQFNAMVEKLQTAREQADRYYQESMARADRLATVGELATAMAHEIQNPLAGLSGVMQILRKEPALSDRKEIIDEALSTVDRLGKTVNDLLNYGRPPKPKYHSCDVNRIVKASLALVRQRHSENNKVKIVEEFGSDLPITWVDLHQMQQVLLNIYLNAIQAMPDGGTMTVRTSYDEHRDHRYVRISVSDTGQGISEDNLGNIFKPFFTTKNRGTGLGLAISRGILDQHGGSIQISCQDGRGTTATIDIPIEDSRAMGEVAPGDEGGK